MNKSGGKWRDITFRSDKNQSVVCVHSKEAREYARILENDPKVETYEVNVPLDMERYQYVNTIDIRKSYFEIAWTTDFVIHYVSGNFGIREIMVEAGLSKKAEIEKLEFSRRYWSSLRAVDWKIVIMEKKEV